MRIGEFAQKHHITQDAIRHYLDMGLLVTEKNGGQYNFNEEDSWDVEKIIELKHLEFSLLEIQEILCFHRLAGDKTDEYLNYYVSLLEGKKEQIMKEQQKYKKITANLKDKIIEFKLVEVNKRRLGWPMSSVSILQCPYCQRTLDISNGMIEKNMIIEASIRCTCEYEATIENGIYIDKRALRKKTLNGKDMPTKKEFLDAASAKYINFYYTGMAMMIDNIQEYGEHPQYIMELESCVGTFFMQYIKYLPKNSTYIFIGQDKDRLTNLKKNIELHHDHVNFIFLCCDMDRLPIARSSIDIMIDHWMTQDFAHSKDCFLMDVVSPLLKDKGLLTGAYPYFSPKTKDFDSIEPKLRDYFNKDIVLDKLRDTNFLKLKIANLGPIRENNTYNLDIVNKDLYLTIYVGQKMIDVESSKVKVDSSYRLNK